MIEQYIEVTNSDQYRNDQSGCNQLQQSEKTVLQRTLDTAERLLAAEAAEYAEISQEHLNKQNTVGSESDDFELIEEGFDIRTHGGGSLENVPDFNLLKPMVEMLGPDTDVPLPEAWSAVIDSAQAHYLRDHNAESVCGVDNRVKIDNVTAPPWRMIAKLVITAADGNRYGGTGWFISPRTVMTAGHCVHSNRSGGWAKSIEVIPSMDSRYRPFGSANATVFKSTAKWTREQDQASDFGCIVLPESNPLGSMVGYFGFSALSNEKLSRLLVNTSGYPGDKSFGTQWYNGGRITKVLPNRLEYMIDTFGGQSGSPLWKYDRTSGSRLAVGIHNYGGCANKATRISESLFQLMQKWKSDGQTTS